MDQKLYNYVIDHSKEIKTLESILNVLTWDQETMLPHGGIEHRCTQQALLATIIHEKKLDPRFFDALSSLNLSMKDKTGDASIQIELLLEDITKARKLPTSFIERFTITTSQAFSAWEKAKPEGSWKLFEPHLEKVVDLVREKASLFGFKEHPLDALLDDHEPGLTTKEAAAIFSSLKPKLQNLLERIKKTSFFEAKAIPCPGTVEEQLRLSHDLLTSIGYDWNKSRLDTAAHPFSSAPHPTDSRITIRRECDDSVNQALSAMHEAGHSMYEMGLNQEMYGTPLGEPVSLSIHESQSRFWETIIGSSKLFAPRLFQSLNKNIPRSKIKTPEELYKCINSVECSFIRTQADEVTYPFHVFLRFEIEKDLLDGSLSVRDIPERWNTGMQAMLGITPPSDREGCLQDIHWSFGTFGYFPSYVFGSMYATSFWEAMQRDLPNVRELILQGSFSPIKKWLHDNVWAYGRKFRAKALVQKKLLRLPSDQEYLSYLEEKYLG